MNGESGELGAVQSGVIIGVLNIAIFSDARQWELIRKLMFICSWLS
jgi:hypothetical protein